MAVGGADAALKGGFDVGDLFGGPAFVEVDACGSLLDEGDQTVVAGAVGGPGEVVWWTGKT